MRRPATIAATLLIAVTPAATADAAPKVKRCGHYGYLEFTQRTGWTSNIRNVDGAGIFNVVSRGVSCATARTVSRRASPERRPLYRNWSCRYLRTSTEYARVRCVRRGGLSVTWETGA